MQNVNLLHFLEIRHIIHYDRPHRVLRMRTYTHKEKNIPKFLAVHFTCCFKLIYNAYSLQGPKSFHLLVTLLNFCIRGEFR